MAVTPVQHQHLKKNRDIRVRPENRPTEDWLPRSSSRTRRSELARIIAMAFPVVAESTRQFGVAAKEKEIFRVHALRAPGEVVAAGDDHHILRAIVDDHDFIVRMAIARLQPDRDTLVGQHADQ